MKKILVALACCLFATTLMAQNAKNIIWIIGDGMGLSAVGLFMEGVRNTDLPQYPDQTSTLEKFLNNSIYGFYFDNTYDTVVTDSSCAATQMACGVLTRPDSIGVNQDDQPVETLFEEAYKHGKSVGVLTDTYVADATPAGFLAHTDSRHHKYEIARQLVNSPAQVVMGGGLKYFNQGENQDLLVKAAEQGWAVVSNKKELSRIKKGRVLGLFSEEAMPFYGDKDQYPKTPTLLEMTQKAIELMSQNENGFVLMVEAGKIDWALHDNEAGPFLWEMINLDETLAYIWQWAQSHPDTLVYLNADHETGVPSFQYWHLDHQSVKHKTDQGEMLYSGNVDYMNYPYFQRLFSHKHLLYYVYPEFKRLPPEKQTAEKLQEMVDKALGEKTDLKLDGYIPSYDDLIRRMNEAQGLVWSTRNHSSGMLLGAAYGPGSDLFYGVYHNTDIKEKMEQILGFAQ